MPSSSSVRSIARSAVSRPCSDGWSLDTMYTPCARLPRDWSARHTSSWLLYIVAVSISPYPRSIASSTARWHSPFPSESHVPRPKTGTGW